ncbi:MAG: hypothetical protein ACYDGW_00325 [Vulcanimicrobiaceae bacterium]
MQLPRPRISSRRVTGSVPALSNNCPLPLAPAAMRTAAAGGTPQTLVSSNGKIFVTALTGSISARVTVGWVKPI